MQIIVNLLNISWHIKTLEKCVVKVSGVHLKVHILKIGVEESIVNTPQITDHGSAVFKCNLTFCVVCVFTLQTNGGAFTIDSSMPTLRINLNEHPI
jgi:hypothetical protein